MVACGGTKIGIEFKETFVVPIETTDSGELKFCPGETNPFLIQQKNILKFISFKQRKRLSLWLKMAQFKRYREWKMTVTEILSFDIFVISLFS